MAITEKQLAKRQQNLGASEIPILFGLARKFGGQARTLGDLWLEKTGKLESPPVLDNEAVQAGVEFERSVLKHAEAEVGSITAGGEFRVKDSPILAHTDGYVRRDKSPIEVKVEGLMWRLREGWGDDNTDVVPYDVMLQNTTQMMGTEADVGYISAFLGGLGFRLYRIGFDTEIADMIRERACSFWEKNVLADIPPTEIPTFDSLKRRIREPKKIITINPVLLDTWQSLKEIADKATERADAAKAEVINALGDAEIGESEYGSVSYFTQTRNALNGEQLKIDHPELYESYLKTSAYRVCRFAKPKPTKVKGQKNGNKQE